MAFILVAIGVDHSDLEPIHKAYGIDPRLPVIEAVVFPFDRQALTIERWSAYQRPVNSLRLAALFD